MNNSFQNDLSQYYSRQIILEELGESGQKKLFNSKIGIIGVGGIGSISALYLALSGVNFLRLIDQDTVETNNLHRQVLYRETDLRLPKVEVAKKRLSDINHNLKIDAISENLRRSNVLEMIEGLDCVVDGLDNMSTRYILNEACVKLNIPYVYGGAIGLEGNVSVFNPPHTPCLRCIYPNLNDRDLPTCDTRGVIGATVGVIGTIQALESIKIISGIKGTLEGKLLFADLKTMDFVSIELKRNPNCSVCTDISAPILTNEENLTWFCGGDTINVNPASKLNLNLNVISDKIKNNYEILVNSPVIIVFLLSNGIEVSLFKQGRMLLKNIYDESVALDVYRKIMSEIEP
tara:strand:- start:172 stop:1212 length:1041 start_codon:yes stop_codon:yes gene_type:complete